MLPTESRTAPATAAPPLPDGSSSGSSATLVPSNTPGFAELGLIEPLLRALSAEGYSVPTPIQLRAIPPLLQGRDLLGCAQTGTGKTAAFALPILQRLHAMGRVVAPTSAGHHGHAAHAHRGAPRPVRALILSPTRELASQIQDRFTAYGRFIGLTSTVIYGGVGQDRQVQRLRAGVDIIVATPGRLLDLMGQGYIELSHVECFVLDEADRMLDMGFIHDVKKVLAKLPAKKQSLLFSATMPRDVEALAQGLLHDPLRIAITPPASTADRLDQRVYFVGKNDKPALLQHLLQNPAIARVLVFTRTKHGANKIARRLTADGTPCDAIHGNKSQNARENALANFKSGRTRVLVATDIAARGIDVEGVTHVINLDLPNEPESYVHRIGRTARAGASGVALSFCSPEENVFLRDIERITRQRLTVVSHPFVSTARDDAAAAPALPPRRESASAAQQPNAPRPRTGPPRAPGTSRDSFNQRNSARNKHRRRRAATHRNEA